MHLPPLNEHACAAVREPAALPFRRQALVMMLLLSFSPQDMAAAQQFHAFATLGQQEQVAQAAGAARQLAAMAEAAQVRI